MAQGQSQPTGPHARLSSSDRPTDISGVYKIGERGNSAGISLPPAALRKTDSGKGDCIGFTAVPAGSSLLIDERAIVITFHDGGD